MVQPVNIRDHNLQAPIPVIRGVMMATVIQGHRALQQVRNHQVGQHQVLTREVQAAVVHTPHLQEAAHPNRTQHLQEAVHQNRTQHHQEAVLRAVLILAEEVAAAEAVAAVAAAVAEAEQDADNNKKRYPEISSIKNKNIDYEKVNTYPICNSGINEPFIWSVC